MYKCPADVVIGKDISQQTEENKLPIVDLLDCTTRELGHLLCPFVNASKQPTEYIDV